MPVYKSSQSFELKMAMNSFVPRSMGVVALYEQPIPWVLDAIVEAFKATMTFRAAVLWKLNLFTSCQRSGFQLMT